MTTDDALDMVQVGGALISPDGSWVLFSKSELDWDENQEVDPSSVEEALAEHSEITHVAMVHCETTTGIMNPLAEVAEVVRKHKRAFILDAMSSFGAWPIDVNATPVDFLVSSANKAIEGVPAGEIGKGRIEVNVIEDDAMIFLDIEDNGKGLPKEQRESLLEPYMTTREKGTGLGLAIVRKIMEEHDGSIALLRGKTDLFIRPPFRFRAVDALLTNFHLPKSSLLVMVSAFAGRELIRRAYDETIARRYRFFSYGDAMLIL